MKRNESGFTLVEMIVTIAIGSLVTLAATTVLLLGLRINNRSTQTVTRQNTARVVITLLENLAAEGEITSIDLKEDQSQGKRGWEIRNAENVVLASYSEEKQAIYVGSAENNQDGTPATPLLEDVSASTISLDQNGLLSISVTIDDIPYNSSIFCRTMRAPVTNESQHDDALSGAVVSGGGGMTATEKEGRTALLDVLTSQYKLAGGSPNPGLILANGGRSTGKYYSEWYVGGYDEVNKPGWNADTPWCACFVSWGLCYPGDDTNKDGEADKNIVVQYVESTNRANGGVAYANVDSFMSYFQNPKENQKQSWKDATYSPDPGDIIFIDWDGDRNDPAHVGVVLKVEGDYVYTIEGNRNNRVAICQYLIGADIIMGYGIIDWKK